MLNGVGYFIACGFACGVFKAAIRQLKKNQENRIIHSIDRKLLFSYVRHKLVTNNCEILLERDGEKKYGKDTAVIFLKELSKNFFIKNGWDSD